VVLGLVPRVGEEDVDRVERGLRDAPAHQVERVAVRDPHAGRPGRLDQREEPCDAGQVCLDGQVVTVGVGGRHHGGRLAHA
jgi:hypothetical protein